MWKTKLRREKFIYLFWTGDHIGLSFIAKFQGFRATSSSNCNIIVLIIKEQEEGSQWADIKWIKSSEKPTTSFCKILAKWPLPGSWLIEALEGFARCRADKRLGRQAGLIAAKNLWPSGHWLLNWSREEEEEGWCHGINWPNGYQDTNTLEKMLAKCFGGYRSSKSVSLNLFRVSFVT